jgi:hypothetical protein
MSDDSVIVQEVRRRRMEISAEFDHDLERYGRHLRQYQEKFRDRLVNQPTVVAAAPAAPAIPKAQE